MLKKKDLLIIVLILIIVLLALAFIFYRTQTNEEKCLKSLEKEWSEYSKQSLSHIYNCYRDCCEKTASEKLECDAICYSMN